MTPPNAWPPLEKSAARLSGDSRPNAAISRLGRRNTLNRSIVDKGSAVEPDRFPEPSRLTLLSWRWQWFVHDRQQKLALWVMHRLPRWLVYWAVIRMASSDRNPDSCALLDSVDTMLKRHEDWVWPR